MTTASSHTAEVAGQRPPFAAPWQAHAFALTLALHERGLFTWPQWTAALSAAIARAQERGEPDDGQTYYHHWLDALETLLVGLGLADSDTLHALEHAWEDAAERTPHGQPVVLPDTALALARGPGPGRGLLPTPPRTAPR
jgi:nitrile hydratase accessory protein